MKNEQKIKKVTGNCLISGQKVERQPGKDIARHNFCRDDPHSANERGRREKGPESIFSDRLFDEGQVDQAEDPDDAGQPDVDADGGEGELVDGARQQRSRRFFVEKIRHLGPML